MSFIPEFDRSTIRCTPDGYFSVHDCIAATNPKKNQHYIWKRLITSYPEVLTKCRFFKFSGRGQREIPVTDREGWAYIISLLPKVIQPSRQSKAKYISKNYRADITVATERVNHSQKNLDNLEWHETTSRYLTFTWAFLTLPPTASSPKFAELNDIPQPQANTTDPNTPDPSLPQRQKPKNQNINFPIICPI